MICIRRSFSGLLCILVGPPSTQGGWDSAVGIATRYGLDGPGIESRWGARFSARVQTGSEAHPASFKMGTGSFSGVKWPGRGVNHLCHLAPRLKKSRAIPLLPLWAFVACSRMNFTFTFTSQHTLNILFTCVTRMNRNIQTHFGYLNVSGMPDRHVNELAVDQKWTTVM